MSDYLYKCVMQGSADVVTVVDTNGRFDYVCPSAERLLGYSQTELLGESGFEYIHPADLTAAKQQFETLVSGDRERITVEFRFERPDGDWVWLEAQVRNLLNDPGIDGIVVSLREVGAGARRDEQFQAFIEHSTDIVTVLDPDGTYQYQSQSSTRLLGYEPEELIGETAFDFIHPDDRQAIMETFGQAVADPEMTPTVEYRFKHEDGSWLWIESIGNNQLDNPAVEGFVVNSRDITERKAAQEQLQRKNERLEEFASLVSHDLRNPLNVARLQLELAEMETDSDHLEDVARAHDRMEALIDDLLSLARNGDEIIEVEAVPLGEITETCWANTRTGTASLITDTDRSFRADRSQLQRLLENLLRNAIEHSDTAVTVTVGECETEPGFYVSDDGTGLPPDNEGRLFESGYSTKNQGTGFGLHIVEQIAKSHGWDVLVAENEDGGARFSITGVEFVDD